MNAVFKKEFRSLLRERRGWLIPVVQCILLGGIACLCLGMAGTSANKSSEVGQWLGGLVAVVQLVALLVFAPLVGAAAIAGERERGTFQVLMASPVDRHSIAIGKFSACSLYCVVLLSASLPVATVAYVFGGMDVAALLGLYFSHFIVATMLVSLGLAISTLFQRTWTASFVAIAASAGLILLTLILGAMLTDMDDWDHGIPFVLLFNPGLSLALFFDGEGQIASQATWISHLGAMLAMAAVALVFTLRRLKRQRL